jgi:hypothetical protein
MKKIKIILLVFLVIVLILIAFGFYTVRGNPKVTVDYLAEYNKISRPINYDPNLNAQNLYNESIDAFFKMPKKLAKISAEWPLDFNKTEQNLLQNWLIANKDSFQKFKEASKKPYYWIESRACNNDLRGIQIFELYGYGLGEIFDAILWDAKVNAVNGNYSDGFEDLLMNYRASFQKCDTPRFIIVLQDSLQNLQRTTRTTLLILKKINVPESALRVFQKDLENLLDTDKLNLGITADKLFSYDALQRLFIYKANGTGHLSWEGIKDFSGYCSSANVGGFEIIKFWLAGLTQKEMKNQIDLYYNEMETTFAITPYQLHQTDPNFFENLYRPDFKTLFLSAYGVTYRGYYYDYYNTQSQLKALVAAIAVLRFQQDKGQLPNNFDELVKVGYLKLSPADPYSDKPLVYKNEAGNFNIYSVGRNFIDDGGKNGTDDIVFWPPRERPKYTDPNQQ